METFYINYDILSSGINGIYVHKINIDVRRNTLLIKSKKLFVEKGTVIGANKFCPSQKQCYYFNVHPYITCDSTLYLIHCVFIHQLFMVYVL